MTGDRKCGIDLLEALASDRSAASGGLTVPELGELTSRHRNLVSRTMADLVAIGLVERNPSTRRMRLSWQMYASAVRISEERLRQRSGRFLVRLTETCGESAYTVIRAGSQAVTVAEATPEQAVVVASWVGRAWPVARSDAGPMLLADLSDGEIRTLLGKRLPATAAARAPGTIDGVLELTAEARQRRVSVLDEQAEADTASAAAPVRDHRGRTAAAIVVTGPSARVRPQLASISARAVAEASALSAELGAPPFPSDSKQPASPALDE